MPRPIEKENVAVDRFKDEKTCGSHREKKYPLLASDEDTGQLCQGFDQVYKEGGLNNLHQDIP